MIFPFRSDTTAYKYITETSRKKEYHFVLWIVFVITASFLYNKNVINGDIISKVQNMKGKRFGRTIQKISGKNNKRWLWEKFQGIKILPYQNEHFSEYRTKSVQEFRFELSQGIRSQIFFATFVKNIETCIKTNAMTKVLKQLIHQQVYHL